MTIRFTDFPPDLKHFTCECLYSTGGSTAVEKYELDEAEVSEAGTIINASAEFSDKPDQMIVSFIAGAGIFERGDLARDIPGDAIHDGMTIRVETSPTFFLSDGSTFSPGPWE